MTKYVFTISIEDEYDKDSITEYLLENLVDELEQKYEEEKVIINAMVEDEEYLIFASNSKVAKEYVACVKDYLGNITFSVSIGLNKILTIKSLDNNGQELDAIDYLNSKVKVDDSVTGGKAAVTEISYIYDRNDIMYGINMKVISLNQLRICLNADITSTEETQKMIELFDIMEDEYETMFGAI